MTHDVFVEMIACLGGHLLRVEVSSLADNTFRARLTFEQAGSEQAIDIRPSDTVAFVVRTETPIYVAGAVLDQAGIVSQQLANDAGQATSDDPRAEVDESKLSPFKEFIETLDIDGLDPGGESRS